MQAQVAAGALKMHPGARMVSCRIPCDHHASQTRHDIVLCNPIPSPPRPPTHPCTHPPTHPPSRGRSWQEAPPHLRPARWPVAAWQSCPRAHPAPAFRGTASWPAPAAAATSRWPPAGCRCSCGRAWHRKEVVLSEAVPAAGRGTGKEGPLLRQHGASIPRLLLGHKQTPTQEGWCLLVAP
jgi:hypothetical protein